MQMHGCKGEDMQQSFIFQFNYKHKGPMPVVFMISKFLLYSIVVSEYCDKREA